ncbi:putative restriction endonuclease [Methanoculleus chikugoensis]|uniref:Putative restriction endonuclease n=1 Tax=Methanoculleus chikugoensis TaxID=118126 RepID=A0A1M4MI58_9EURY|nr:HNH endonuclease [Methanoculleus chikugoensis]SCL74585.1 putative restriction endonuclease [Methanoculleus chikugoensis]
MEFGNEHSREPRYVRSSKRKNDYWIALFHGMLDKYTSKYGDHFRITIVDNDNPSEFYDIPYALIKPALAEAGFDSKRNRWVCTINDHIFRVHGVADRIDVRPFFWSLGVQQYEDVEVTNSVFSKDFVGDSRTEGNVKVRISTVIERDPALRSDALRIHGFNCAVCGFNFEEHYGEWGENFAEVHHIIPLSEYRGTITEVNPKTDLVVLCSNCHSMIHRKRGVTLTVDELKGKMIVSK